MSADFQKVRAVFLAALERPPDSWKAYLDEACAGIDGLREQVQMLLDAHVEGTGMLDRTGPAAAPGADQPVTAPLGAQIGPYKLLQQIGEGGMGVVYLAEQHEPVRRKVALKVIKPGMDTRQVIARFEAERQALSLMDHPNIARVLDAGAVGQVGSPSHVDRPYFVMELVKGLPITQYCDEKRLTPRQRLELLLPVCHAIQHAHQKGIIHRDIKPSNVLVAEYDGQPAAKVIDFGVAKAISQALTEKTMFTGLGQIVGTLEYMSPEQAKVNQLDIDTRSDIYSLGVLMYELLTGSTPIDKQRLRSAAWDEMLRMIRDEEPPKPSTRLSDSRDSLPSISAQRQTEPARLTRLVRGELDWIVMKALDKDRNRRYETASDFAADVQRYLNDEAVLACPPSRAYRFRKLARRNKVALGGASMLAIVLVLAVATLAVVNVWIIRERNEKADMVRQKEAALQLAKRENQRAVQNLAKAREAVDQMLTRVGAEQLKDVPQMEVVRREILEDALKFYQGFLQQDSADPNLRLATALSWHRMGSILVYLGKYAEAQPALIKAHSLLAELLRETPGDRECRTLMAENQRSLGWVLKLVNRREEANAHYARAVDLFRALAEEFPAESFQDRQVDCQWVLATLLNEGGDRQAAEDAFRQVVRFRRMRAKDDSSDWPRYWLAEACRDLGSVLHNVNPSEAEQAYEEAIAILKGLTPQFSALPECRHQMAWTYDHFAQLQREKGNVARAEELNRQGLALSAKLTQEFPHAPNYREGMARNLLGLAHVLKGAEKREESEQAFRQAIECYEQLLAESPSRIAFHPELGRNRAELAVLLSDAGRDDEAEDSYRKALVDFAKAIDSEPQFAPHYNQAAWFLSRFPGREQPIRDRAFHWAKKAVELDPNAASSLNTLGVAAYRAGDFKSAVSALEKAESLAPDEAVAFNGLFLAMAYWRLDDKVAAAKWFNQSVEWMEKRAPNNEELRRFRGEASDLLGLSAPPQENNSLENAQP